MVVTESQKKEKNDMKLAVKSIKKIFGNQPTGWYTGRCSENTLDLVIDIWKTADLQEREIWDLMGIQFEGHPNLKRILLWEGFDGHPLRKDYLGN